MALTLLQAAVTHATNGEFKKAGITKAFASGHPIIAAMPAVNIMGNAYTWNEEGVLPSVAARAVGENYTASEGKFTPRTEPLKIYGGTLNVDRVITKTLGEERRAEHQALKAKALGQSLGHDIIQGSTTGNTKLIDGLMSRYLFDNAKTLDSEGTACSMAEMDEVAQRVSNPTHWLMTLNMARRINVYLRSSGTAVRMEKDAFGRPLMFYGDLPILIADPLDVHDDYKALQDGDGDDGSGETSIFCLSLSTDGIHLIQNGGMEIEDLGTTDEGTSKGTLVEWIVGLADEGPHCVSRYAGIDLDAAVVA